MVTRDCAYCDGKIIGIETVYTVNNLGKQINIPDKVEELRCKSRNNELFCPCGCGANLVLVAGDNNIRDQHFRIKHSEYEKNCHLVTEGKNSIDSKVVLKCWLEDKLRTKDIESRVPISEISESDRKYEFTFLSRRRGIAINYSNERQNLSDEKLSILDDNSDDLSIIHIVDMSNEESNGQYPENLMKIQSRQGYVLFLSVCGRDYEAAHMKAAFYEKNIDEEWQEIIFADDILRGFNIEDGFVTFIQKRLDDILLTARIDFARKQDAERQRRIDLEKQRQLQIANKQAEIAKKKAEELKRAEEIAKRKEEEAERQSAELEREKAEKRKQAEEFEMTKECDFRTFVERIIDGEGNRWVQCRFCGKKGLASKDFSSYGGQGMDMNLGTCYECSRKGLTNAVQKSDISQNDVTYTYDSIICPECHEGKMVERSGPYGKFLGCSRFPKCKHKEKIYYS